MKHYILNLWFLNINRSMSEWICPKCREKKKARLRYDNVLKTAWTDEWYDWIDCISKMQRNTPFCVLLKKKSICSWFYHTIFKVFTTQSLYPKSKWMDHFTSFWKKNPPPPLPLLVSRGLACMRYVIMADMKVKYDNITILTWSLIGRFVMLAIMYFKTFKSKNRLLFSNFQLFGFLNICYQVSELIYIIVIQVLVWWNEFLNM